MSKNRFKNAVADRKVLNLGPVFYPNGHMATTKPHDKDVEPKPIIRLVVPTTERDKDGKYHSTRKIVDRADGTSTAPKVE